MIYVIRHLPPRIIRLEPPAKRRQVLWISIWFWAFGLGVLLSTLWLIL